jgi:hypothetical protein
VNILNYLLGVFEKANLIEYISKICATSFKPSVLQDISNPSSSIEETLGVLRTLCSVANIQNIQLKVLGSVPRLPPPGVRFDSLSKLTILDEDCYEINNNTQISTPALSGTQPFHIGLDLRVKIASAIDLPVNNTHASRCGNETRQLLCRDGCVRSIRSG